MSYFTYERIFGHWKEDSGFCIFPDTDRLPTPSIYDFVSDQPMLHQDLIIKYLNRGYALAGHRGFSKNILDPDKPIRGGDSIRTDGRWLWRVSVPYYVEHHQLILPPEFIDHIFRVLQDTSKFLVSRETIPEIRDEFKSMVTR